MKPIKFFNFAMPFEMYQKLRTAAIENEIPVAELVRRGIAYVLENKRMVQGDVCKCKIRE